MSKSRGSQLRGFGEFLVLQTCMLIFLPIPMLASIYAETHTPGLHVTTFDFIYIAVILALFGYAQSLLMRIVKRGYSRSQQARSRTRARQATEQRHIHN